MKPMLRPSTNRPFRTPISTYSCASSLKQPHHKPSEVRHKHSRCASSLKQPQHKPSGVRHKHSGCASTATAAGSQALSENKIRLTAVPLCNTTLIGSDKTETEEKIHGVYYICSRMQTTTAVYRLYIK